MHITPFGDRILCKRKKTGTMKKESLIELPDIVKDRPTDLAIVAYVPNQTFTDQQLISNAEAIVKSHAKKASEGSSDALNSLMQFNDYLCKKTIKVGDEILIQKYCGMDFYDNQGEALLTLVDLNDVIGVVSKDA